MCGAIIAGCIRFPQACNGHAEAEKCYDHHHAQASSTPNRSSMTRGADRATDCLKQETIDSREPRSTQEARELVLHRIQIVLRVAGVGCLMLIAAALLSCR